VQVHRVILHGRVANPHLDPFAVSDHQRGNVSLGEGVIMGYNLTQGLGVALQPLPILSFALHKVVEGTTAGLLARDSSWPALGLWLTAIAGLPGLVGLLVGFAGLPGSVSTIAYALGAGTLLFVLPKFLTSRSDRDWIWSQSLGVGLGFLFMYLAALLHEL
jgi:zinc transporter ZupT